MMIRAAFAAIAATLVLGGCATVPDPHALNGTEWQLTAIDTAGSTTTLTPAVQRRHTIAFREEGALEAQLDCNRGRATWSAQKPMNGAGAITIGPVASTRMLCPEPSFGEALAQGLTGAERFITTLDGRQLVLETGTLRYTFTAAE
jgi:heat shock protein HslJ